MRIALAQCDFLVGDIEGNCRKILDSVLKARKQLEANLVVFPELTLTGYPPEDLLLRSGFLNDCEAALEKLSVELASCCADIYVLLGHPDKEGDTIFNTASLLINGKVIASYRKQILPNYSVFDEKRYFTPGDQSCVVDIDGIPAGITICEDIWVDEPIQQAVEKGAKIILNLNASPFFLGRTAEREEQVRQQVRSNKVPVVYVNVVGGQDELVFDGASFVMNAQGDVVMRARSFEENIAAIDVLPSESGDIEIRVAEIAPELDEESQAFAALVLGVRDYVNKNGFKGAVLGLSGGIDSALTLVVAVEALGAENVEAVMMPSRYTAEMSIEDAQTLAENLKVSHHVIPIEKAFNSFISLLTDEFKGTAPGVAEENIQARCRGVILMAISNKKGKIVLTTGNKSEMAVGYTTLYGDMAGGFNVLKDVPKNLVYRLSRYYNTLKGTDVIPKRIIDRAPSAELRENQTDQDSLPDYDILDPIMEAYVERDCSVSEIVALGFDRETVVRVIDLIDHNEYKRRQAPPGIRITPKAFGKDRRMPIVNRFKDLGENSRSK